MSLVWDHFSRGGSEKLALLALADWANDTGGSLHPSMQTLADKICCSRSQAQRIVHQFIADGLLSVVGNENGGAPGTTRQYRLNVELLKTGRTGATGSADATGRTDAQDGSHPCTGTGRMGAPRRVAPVRPNPSVKQPPIDPPKIHQCPPASPTAPDEPVSETDLQAACRATWAAYSAAFTTRYSTSPVRNQTVNSQVKALVRRIGFEESPLVAAYYVGLNTAYYVRRGHQIAPLLADAEKVRTEWATNRPVTETRARQLDKTASNGFLALLDQQEH